MGLAIIIGMVFTLIVIAWLFINKLSIKNADLTVEISDLETSIYEHKQFLIELSMLDPIKAHNLLKEKVDV